MPAWSVKLQALNLVDLLQAQPPPTALKLWVVSSLPTGKQSSFISSKSTAAIPWKTTVAQQKIMKTSYKCRFQVENRVAHLYPKSQSRCSLYGTEGWSDPCMIRECLVITETVSYPAKGKCAYILNAIIDASSQFSVESVLLMNVKGNSTMMLSTNPVY